MRTAALGSGVVGLGGKADALDRCAAAGLPVPRGVVLDAEAAEAVAAGEPAASAALAAEIARLSGPFAVRSSGRAEDGATASFAGQLTTVLAVGPGAVGEAVAAVIASGRASSVQAYQRQRGLDEDHAVNVVVQSLIDAAVSGVLFTRDPVTGAPGPVIEATWGLGTSVVDGLVVPDRVTPAGYEPGDKDVEQVLGPNGVEEQPVSEPRRSARCLDGTAVAALTRLAEQVEHVIAGNGLDIEWAFDRSGGLWLLQARPITTLEGPAGQHQA